MLLLYPTPRLFAASSYAASQVSHTTLCFWLLAEFLSQQDEDADEEVAEGGEVDATEHIDSASLAQPDQQVTTGSVPNDNDDGGVSSQVDRAASPPLPAQLVSLVVALGPVDFIICANI